MIVTICNKACEAAWREGPLGFLRGGAAENNVTRADLHTHFGSGMVDVVGPHAELNWKISSVTIFKIQLENSLYQTGRSTSFGWFLFYLSRAV